MAELQDGGYTCVVLDLLLCLLHLLFFIYLNLSSLSSASVCYLSDPDPFEDHLGNLISPRVQFSENESELPNHLTHLYAIPPYVEAC